MKAATGELNLTLITVVAIGLIMAAFVLWWNNKKDDFFDVDPETYSTIVDNKILLDNFDITY